MVAKRSNDWPYIRRKALSKAEALGASSNSDQLPTAIGRIAEQQLVKGIRFKPLLVEGAVSVESDGFLISIRCEDAKCAEFERSLKRDPTGKALPNRIRFNLAHEIAHTFFFDLGSSPPRSKVNVENANALHTLEMACHMIAGALLLPSQIFEREFGNKKTHLPDVLREIAKRSRISKSALVSRFSGLHSSMLPWAVVACVRTTGGEPYIEALWRHYSFRAMFRELEHGKPLRSISTGGRLKALQIYGGSYEAVALDVPVETGATEKWLLEVESGADALTKNSFLIALFRQSDFPADYGAAVARR